jgi:phytoene dehydrogenase-like protein
MTAKTQSVVIVGAGMAGLTAAAYLARHNARVLLLDKNDRSGGLVHTFNYAGFAFDAGPRAFVNSGMVKPMLKDLGIACDLVDNTLSIGIEDQLFRVESMDSLEDYERMLKTLYPQHIGEIEEIISATEKLSGYTKILYEFDNPNFTDVMSDVQLIVKKLIPWTVKFLIALRKMNRFSMPMEAFLEDITDNPSLMDIVTQFFFRGTPTYFALGYFYVYLDYFYPRGGTGVLADRLREKVLRSGVDVKLNTHITEVMPSEAKVKDTEGNSYPYDHLIWAADLKTLYRSVNTAGLDAMTAQQIQATTQSTLAAKGAESVFILFMGVNRPPSYFRARGGEHMFYTPSREGLGETNRGERQRLIEDFDVTSRDEVEDWLGDFCRLNTYEVSIPALRDPSLAPQGQTGVMISFLFDYSIAENIQKADWYDEFKQLLEDHVIRLFSQTIYRGIEADILFKFSSTPLTINDVSGSSGGAITGWSFETEVPVVNRLKDIPKSVLTPIPGVLQAGQWAYSPSGVPIAMLTGWYATQEIAKRSKRG